MLRLPPTESLEAVIESNRHGSFSGAADSLNLTHGAVSRRVAAVEAWAGYRIFERHGRGVRATQAGYALLLQIEQAVALLNDSRSIRNDARSLDVVRVGVVPSFARMWLFSNLANLEGSPPDLRIEPEIDNNFMALSDARIAIRYGFGDWPNVRSMPMFEEKAVPVACRSIAEAFGGAPDPSGLFEWSLLHDGSSADWTHWLGRSGLSYSQRSQDRTFDAYDLTLQAAAQGLGIALLREPYGNGLSKALELVPLPLSSHTLTRRFHVLLGAKKPTKAAMRLVDRIFQFAGTGISGA